jgi:hypothetical protein
MDWQFFIGLGIAVVFGFLPFAVKEMPQPVTWSGITIGVLFILWGAYVLLPGHQKLPTGPALVLIASVAGIIASIVWYKAPTLEIQTIANIELQSSDGQKFDRARTLDGDAHVELFKDGTITAQFTAPIDPRTLIVRILGTFEPLNIIERSAQKVRFKLAPLGQNSRTSIVIEAAKS